MFNYYSNILIEILECGKFKLFDQTQFKKRFKNLYLHTFLFCNIFNFYLNLSVNLNFG